MTDEVLAARLWHRSGLRWGALVAALLGASLFAMFALMFWQSSVLLFETLDRSVTEQLELLSARPPDLLPFMIRSRMSGGPLVVTRVGLFEPDGTPVVGDIRALPRKLRLNAKVQAIAVTDRPGEHWRAAGKRLASGRILVVARPSDEIIAVRADLRRGALLGIVPAILLSLGGGALVGIASERRLRRLTAVAERIIDGALDERLPTRAHGDELDRLCATVNRMLARLEALVAALQATGENIAHDLRTPLTALRARLERAQGLAPAGSGQAHLLDQSLRGVDQALAIVTALLRIADIRHLRRRSGFGPVALAEILLDTEDAYRPVAEDKNVALTCDCHLAPIIDGDRQLLVEALVNLVDNAVKFTPSGGAVRLTLEGPPHAPTIVVADTGPGIPHGATAAIFNRFYRAEASRTTPGHGLGLSLVAEIVALHRFTITLEDNAPGCRAVLRCRAPSESNA